jgi:hypothetical protein
MPGHDATSSRIVVNELTPLHVLRHHDSRANNNPVPATGTRTVHQAHQRMIGQRQSTASNRTPACTSPRACSQPCDTVGCSARRVACEVRFAENEHSVNQPTVCMTHDARRPPSNRKSGGVLGASDCALPRITANRAYAIARSVNKTAVAMVATRKPICRTAQPFAVGSSLLVRRFYSRSSQACREEFCG